MTVRVDTNTEDPLARRTAPVFAEVSPGAHSQRPETTRSDRAGNSSPQRWEGSQATARLPATGAAARDLSASSATRNRRLHAGHFAFMRAVVQGVDVSAAWDRYLRIEGESSDARAIRSTMAWIRDEFAAAAQRHARYGVARLVRLDSARLAAGAQARLPALEDFALERGLEDFSQADQLEAFEAEYRDILRRTRRRERLIDRQLEALGWLESLAEQPHRARRAAAQPPRANDSVDVWLNPLLARHLRGAGLATLGQLAERINGIGLRWYASIRGLGPVKAERILSWLRDHQASIAASGGAAVGLHVDRPRSRVSRSELAAVLAPATDIRPLEKLILPPSLDGSCGPFRQPQRECRLGACNDVQAVLAWLQSKALADPRSPSHAPVAEGALQPPGSAWITPLTALGKMTHTQRSYRKEAERMLLWAIVERGRPLSALSAEDCVAYRDFISNPQPRERWCAPRSRERWSPLWRPFEGPLSPAAQRQALRILGNLFNFLTRQNYLAGNPWPGVGLNEPDGPVVERDRSFTAAQWEVVRRELASLPDSRMARRLRFALEFLRATRVRLSEAVAATVDHLRPVESAARGEDPHVPCPGWRLVVGKGAKQREVAVPLHVIEMLGQALEARGLAADPMHRSNHGVFLLEPLPEGRALRSGAARADAEPGGAANSADPAVLVAGTVGRVDRPVSVVPTDQGGLAPSTLAAHLKRFFARCAASLAAAGDERGAERLRSAGAHWIRNTGRADALAAEAPIALAPVNAGGASGQVGRTWQKVGAHFSHDQPVPEETFHVSAPAGIAA
jgi:site-specific recombinase XerD